VPVVERPELPGIPLGVLDELSLIFTRRVTHWPFCLCRFKRAPSRGGYEAQP
jgi:hypothetical protein